MEARASYGPAPKDIANDFYREAVEAANAGRLEGLTDMLLAYVGWVAEESVCVCSNGHLVLCARLQDRQQARNVVGLPCQQGREHSAVHGTERGPLARRRPVCGPERRRCDGGGEEEQDGHCVRTPLQEGRGCIPLSVQDAFSNWS